MRAEWVIELGEYETALSSGGESGKDTGSFWFKSGDSMSRNGAKNYCLHEPKSS